MTTTIVFIEHLVAGLQAALWIVLLIMSIFGWNWINIDRMKGFEVVLGVWILALIYPLGVAIDTIADDIIFKKWSKKIRSNILKDKSRTAMKLLSETKAVFLVNYLNYVRSRIRIARSAALNFFLITVTAIILTVTRLTKISSQPLWLLLAVEIGFGIILIGTTVFSWKQITETYAEKINMGFDIDSEETVEAVLDAGMGR